MMNIYGETFVNSALHFSLTQEEPKYSFPAGGRVTPQWRLSLDALIDLLERLPGLTELRFLKVGSMLQEISALLMTIGDGAEKAARTMSGEELLSVMSDMEQLLDRIENDFLAEDKTAGQVGNLLGGILGELENMDRLLEGFKGHVGNLRMLKLLTNIQASSLRERGVGFGNVAADIGALSQNIHVKSDAILSRVKALKVDLSRGRSMVSALGATQKMLNQTMVSAVRSKITIMAEMHANCSIAARNISSCSGEISRDVAAIVVATQFQDITRQQMEHARDALDGVRKRVASDGILSAELAGICALQSAQLVNSADELVRAVTGIASCLQAVADEASGTSARVHSLFRQTDGVGRSSLADIEQSLGSLSGAFAENMTARERLADIIQVTTAAMGEITGFAEEIDFLGSEIRLIALNAIIKAVQTGKEGAAFSVIAENIKQQSDDICRQAATINSSIQTITLHVIELHHKMHREGDQTSTLRTEEFAATVACLRGLIDGAGELLLTTDKAADSMAEIIAGTSVALSSGELISIVQKELLPRVKRLAVGLCPHDRWSDGVQGAELSYTMGSERAVHQRFMEGSGSGGWNDELGKDPFRSIPVDQFMDNVEFFSDQEQEHGVNDKSEQGKI